MPGIFMQKDNTLAKPFAKNGHHKLSVPQWQSADSVAMVKEIQNKHMFMVPRQFSTVIFTDDNASVFFAGGRW